MWELVCDSMIGQKWHNEQGVDKNNKYITETNIFLLPINVAFTTILY